MIAVRTSETSGGESGRSDARGTSGRCTNSLEDSNEGEEERHVVVDDVRGLDGRDGDVQRLSRAQRRVGGLDLVEAERQPARWRPRWPRCRAACHGSRRRSRRSMLARGGSGWFALREHPAEHEEACPFKILKFSTNPFHTQTRKHSINHQMVSHLSFPKPFFTFFEGVTETLKLSGRSEKRLEVFEVFRHPYNSKKERRQIPFSKDCLHVRFTMKSSQTFLVGTG